jgi:P-type conjugative transfer protein TrbJ
MCYRLILLLVVMLLPRPSHAQWAVIDVDNIAQSVLEYKKQIEQYAQQIEQTQRQIDLVFQGQKNLATLKLNNVQGLRSLYQQLDAKLSQAQGLGYQADQVWQQAQALYPKMTGTRTAAQQRQLERTWAAAQRNAASIALQTQALQRSQQVYEAQWSEVLAKAAAAEGNLQIQQAAVQGQGLLGGKLMAIEQQLATQARETSQRNLREATRSEMEQNALEVTGQAVDTTYTPQGTPLTLSTGQGN